MPWALQAWRRQRYTWCASRRMKQRDAMRSTGRRQFASTGRMWFPLPPAHSPVSAVASTVPQMEAGKGIRRWRRYWQRYHLSLPMRRRHRHKHKHNGDVATGGQERTCPPVAVLLPVLLQHPVQWIHAAPCLFLFEAAQINHGSGYRAMSQQLLQLEYVGIFLFHEVHRERPPCLMG
jgi:hypothetical protein